MRIADFRNRIIALSEKDKCQPAGTENYPHYPEAEPQEWTTRSPSEKSPIAP
jgi:hypothetical protein